MNSGMKYKTSIVLRVSSNLHPYRILKSAINGKSRCCPSGGPSRNLPEASRAQVKQQLQPSFPEAFRKPSGRFRNCGETETGQTSLPVSLPGTLRKHSELGEI